MPDYCLLKQNRHSFLERRQLKYFFGSACFCTWCIRIFQITPIPYLCHLQLPVMQTIDKKTLEDLEFPLVLQQLSDRCSSELGKAGALAIQPISVKEDLSKILGQTSEYLASFSNENKIPNHGFDAINN